MKHDIAVPTLSDVFNALRAYTLRQLESEIEHAKLTYIDPKLSLEFKEVSGHDNRRLIRCAYLLVSGGDHTPRSILLHLHNIVFTRREVQDLGVDTITYGDAPTPHWTYNDESYQFGLASSLDSHADSILRIFHPSKTTEQMAEHIFIQGLRVFEATKKAHPGQKAPSFFSNNLDNVHPVTLATPAWVLHKLAYLRTTPELMFPAKVLSTLLDNIGLDFIEAGMPHKGLKTGSLVFTPSNNYAIRDRVVSISPGKYIRKMTARDLPDHVIRDLAVDISNEIDIDFKIVPLNRGEESRELIRWVYTKGPSSCMSYTCDERFTRTGDVHPSEVYCHPDTDLSIAYMTSNGSIRYRCLVNSHNKTYGTIYPKSNTELMEQYLSNEGYSKDLYLAEGQPVLKITDPTGTAFVLPYFDPDNNGVEDRGEHFVIAGDPDDVDYQGYYETGLSREVETFCCDHCGDEVDDQDDLTYVADHGDVCEHCLDDSFRYAIDYSGEREYIHEDDAFYVDAIEDHVDESLYDDSERMRSLFDLVMCLYFDEYVHVSEATLVFNTCLEPLGHVTDSALAYDYAEEHFSGKFMPKYDLEFSEFLDSYLDPSNDNAFHFIGEEYEDWFDTTDPDSLPVVVQIALLAEAA